MNVRNFLNQSTSIQTTGIVYWPAVNFINNKRARFSYKRLFSSYVLALNKLSYEKFVRKNVDEIDTWTTSNTNMEGKDYETHMILFLAIEEQSQVVKLKPLHLGTSPTYHQFHQHYMPHISYESLFGSFYYIHVTRKKAAKKTFVWKKLANNVDEIDT